MDDARPTVSLDGAGSTSGTGDRCVPRRSEPVRRTPIFSTRSSTLGQRVGSVDGLLGRFIDIPFTEGQAAFEDLHGLRDEEAFAAELNRLTKKNCGFALNFSEWQVDGRDWEPGEQIEFFRASRRKYQEIAQRYLTSTKQNLTPLHDQFSTIYAAGASVADTVFVPWSLRELANAILECEEDAIRAADNVS
jgi:hypothetical protein